MTATKKVLIECDAVGQIMGRCGERWAGRPNQTTFSARTDAKAAGWRYSGGRDWCPDHAGKSRDT